MAPTHGTFRVKIRTQTRHISKFFGNWQNRRCLFTPDLILFRSNKARYEGISANSQTQHWRSTNIWPAVTSSHGLFLRRNRVNLELFFKPWLVWPDHPNAVKPYGNTPKNSTTSAFIRFTSAGNWQLSLHITPTDLDSLVVTLLHGH